MIHSLVSFLFIIIHKAREVNRLFEKKSKKKYQEPLSLPIFRYFAVLPRGFEIYHPLIGRSFILIIVGDVPLRQDERAVDQHVRRA